jgi:N-acetylglucosaminyldiphosphoundecaprenol N-acetyl-beta-D-mannosaminyltransferase
LADTFFLGPLTHNWLRITGQNLPDTMQNNTAAPITPPQPARIQHWILGLPFDAITMQEAIDRVRTAAKNRTPLFISTPNLNFLIASQKDQEFRESVVNSDLSLADGMPIIWLAKLLNLPIPERVAGSNLFEALRYQPLKTGERPLKVYFFGGSDGIAQRACDAINQDSSSMVCCGYMSPGFGSLEEMSTSEIRQQINTSKADFLVVSLGAKKGQAWIERNRKHISIPVISHLGAVVNFVAGEVQRAPVWVQRTGLEWAWRILEEPSLWKRYLSDGAGLLILISRKIVPELLKRARKK